MTHRCVYGPVPSRRFGLSLGVDLIPFKICCYDCLYCQVGRTTEHTVARRDFVEPAQVAREVAEALQRGGAQAECVTLSGSGEPTLHRGLGEVVTGLRGVTKLPLVLLTNGGLLWDEEVAAAARRFDVVAPTLTAADPETFARLNRPHLLIDYGRMWHGLGDFCKSFPGQLRLEVMLVRGLNDSPAALHALAAGVSSLGTIQIDLNTPVRPSAYPEAEPLSAEALEAARALFEQAGCRVSVIAEPPRRPAAASAPPDVTRRRVLETVSRRPCTLEDLSTALGLTPAVISAALHEALAARELVEEAREGQRYFRTPR